MEALKPYPPGWWDHPVGRDWMVHNMMEFRRTQLPEQSFAEGNRIVRDVLNRLETGCNQAGYLAPDWVLRARAMMPTDERSEWLARSVTEFVPDGLEGEPYKAALSRILDGFEANIQGPDGEATGVGRACARTALHGPGAGRAGLGRHPRTAGGGWGLTRHRDGQRPTRAPPHQLVRRGSLLA